MKWRFDNTRVQLLLRFGYEGSVFHGLQPQPDVPTAGGALRTRLREAGIEPKRLTFAARTDKGVHAENTVATCFFRRSVDYTVHDLDLCRAAIEATRNDGLRNVRVTHVGNKIHARGCASAKLYRYMIRDGLGGEIYRPRDHQEYWPVSIGLCAESMHQAAQSLVGLHDFSSFRSPRCQAPNPVRQLMQLSVVRENTGEIVINIHGASFLRQMVRIIVGTLGLVGSGMVAHDELSAILLAKDRSRAGPIAPAGGLTLVQVFGDFGDGDTSTAALPAEQSPHV